MVWTNDYLPNWIASMCRFQLMLSGPPAVYLSTRALVQWFSLIPRYLLT
jgi:hypothetical protein